MTNLNELPADLAVPRDDGAAEHLPGMRIPRIELRSTADRMVNLADLSKEQTTVVYCYPMTGVPGKALPVGWNDIPGARGCTPQSCNFRDHFQEIKALDAVVFGLSTQDSEYQREMVQRLELPFEVLSDQELKFTRALNLPTFEVEGKLVTKRLTLILSEGKIVKVFYPVFPPDRNAEEVIEWLNHNPQSS
jgi:peroxiredoxin